MSGERDQARKEYADLRKQFETLKQDQGPKEESGKFRKELEQQLDGFRQKLEERNREIAALKATSGGGSEGTRKKPEQEIISLREQLDKVKGRSLHRPARPGPQPESPARDPRHSARSDRGHFPQPP